MNTAEDIKRMLGELVDEAIRIGRTEGEKALGTDAKLKEQVERLVDEKRALAQQLNVLAGENDFLEDKVSKLRAKIDEQNEALAIYRVPTPRACPFCGGPAEVHQLRKDEWYVACGNSDCPVNPETNTFDTEAEAIEAWNNSYNWPKVTCDWR